MTRVTDDLAQYKKGTITLDDLADRWAQRNFGGAPAPTRTAEETWLDDDHDWGAEGTWGEVRSLFNRGVLTSKEYVTISRAADEAAGAADRGIVTEVKDVKAKGGVDRNRGGAEELREYWVHGEGAAKIGWGTPGDFMRCVALVSEHMAPERAKGYCNLRHHDALGNYPGDHKNYTPVPKETPCKGCGDKEVTPVGEMLTPTELHTKDALRAATITPAGQKPKPPKGWDEEAHPRHGEGPSGGRFKEKDAGEEGGRDIEELDDEDRKKIRDLVDSITGGGTRKDMTRAQRQALRKMVDVMVEPVDRDSDRPYAHPWKNLGDDDRKLMRSIIDDMTGDGRFRDLTDSAKAAVREIRAALDDAKDKQ